MSGVVIEAHRRRFLVKLTPMQPLKAAVEDVLGQLQLSGQVQPKDCRLLLNKKQLDIETPLRFANIGSTAKLELQTGREPKLGVQEAPSTAPGALAPPSTSFAAAPPTSAAAASANTASAPVSTAAAPAQQQQQQQQQQVSSAEQQAPANQPPSVAVFGQEVYVFRREAEEEAESAAAGGSATDDTDEAFYEFTEGDLARVMASYAAQRAREEGGHLMTRQMREREEDRKAASYGPVTIRLLLPDGHILQTAFAAAAPLSRLHSLAQRALLPGLPFHLFTTPPKTKLKDLNLSLYKASLVPAAKVYIGLDSPEGAAPAPLLRPEVLALVGPPPARHDVLTKGRQQQRDREAAQLASQAGGSAAATAGGNAGRAPGGSKSLPTGSKVPKWLKTG